MTAPTPRIALLLISLVLASACDRELPAPAKPETLSRPTVAVAIRNGRVLAPRDTVTELGGTPGVFVVTDGIARFRMVRTGKTENNRVEILSGLTGTEQLVAGDLRGVHDGSAIAAASGS